MDQTVDSNNNTEVGKYSLRPRTASRISEEEESLKDGGPKKRCKRAPSLSRHRRRSANARERSRMKEINDAFEELRKVVTWSGDVPEKTTKISTLRLAIRYISALTDALRDSEVSDPSMVRDIGTARDRPETFGMETSRDSCDRSAYAAEHPRPLLHPQISLPSIQNTFISTNSTSGAADYFLPTTSDGESIVSNFEQSFANFRYTSDYQHPMSTNLNCVKSWSDPTLRGDTDPKLISERKSDFAGGHSCVLRNDKHRKEDSTEFFEDVSSIPGVKTCFSSNSITTNPVYFGHERDKTEEVSQLEELLPFLPLEN